MSITPKPSLSFGIKFVYLALVADAASMGGFLLGTSNRGAPFVIISILQILAGLTVIFWLWKRLRHARWLVTGFIAWRTFARIVTLYLVGVSSTSQANATQIQITLILGIALVYVLFSKTFRNFVTTAQVSN